MSSPSHKKSLDLLEGLITAIRPLTKASSIMFQDRTEYLEAIEASVPAMIVGRDGTVLYSTPPLTDMFGYLPGGLTGKHYTIVVPERFREKHTEHFEKFWENPERRRMGFGPMNLQGQKKNGSEFPVSVGLSPREMVSCGEVVVVTVLERHAPSTPS